ncbi:MAG TPA: CHAT domain-containing protein [Bryobacteraceae bacterium]|nr:CHAT domain-containing protein [Bryobacteraceae bacterium]
MVSVGHLRYAALLLSAVLCGCGGDSDRVLLDRADLLLRKGELAEALSAADRGWRRWQGDPSSEYHWRFRLKKAEVHLAQGGLEQALPLVDAEPPARFGRLRAVRLTQLGTARLYQGRYPDAESALVKAASLAAESGDRRLQAEVALRRGTALVRQGEFDAAERAFHEALVFGRSAGDTFIEASARGNSGFLALHRSRFEEAIPHFERALELARGIGARKIENSSYANLGKAWQGMGDLERATEFLSRAEKGAKAIGDEHSRQICLGGLAGIFQEQREPKRAAAAYKEALASARRVRDPYSVCAWLNAFSAVSLDLGDVESARKMNADALELASRLSSADSRVGATLVQGRIAEAQGRVADAETIYREIAGSTIETVSLTWQAQSLLSGLLWRSGRSAEAEAGFRHALVSLEQVRSRLQRAAWQLSFQSASRRFYEDYVEFLMSAGRTEDALAVAEASRARVLAGRLGLAGAIEKKGSSGAVDAAGFMRLARDSGAVLVSFWLAPRRSFVWTVTPDGVRAATLPPEGELRGIVDAYSAAITFGRDPIDTGNDAGRRLAGALLPLLNIPAGSRVLIALDGVLHAVNLETLPVQTPKPHYWIEDVTIAVVPSLSLARARERSTRSRTLLLIGDPRPPEGEFEALPAAAGEVARVRERLKSFQQSVYTGPEAKPPVYGDAGPGRFSLIHFAAHATSNSQDPLDSAVVLSQSPGGYKLYARDILKLPLRARVVTLSSCRGAGSRLYRGEGLVGFAWAFLHAGAENVVAGLWDVNDASTAALMDEFYAAIGAGGSPPEALRTAKLALLRSEGAWRKPYYWAPFEIFSRAPSFSLKRSGPEKH